MGGGVEAPAVTSRHISSRASGGTRWSQNLRTLATAWSSTFVLRLTMELCALAPTTFASWLIAS